MSKILIDRAVVEQALEALEKEPADYADWTRTMKAARAALRTALAEPCEMGAMCLNCQPRGPNGECPDAPQPERKERSTDMTDHELLELAAKAAGIELRWHPDGTAYSDSRCKDYWGVWNPLTDDGDAQRLAVKCHLNVCVGYGSVSTCLQDDGSFYRIEEIKDDPYAATRRAIVRTAAEIGFATTSEKANHSRPMNSHTIFFRQ